MRQAHLFCPASLMMVVMLAASASAAFAAAGDPPPVSWFREVTPIFKRSCNGCHNPNKLKGEVDTSTYQGFLKPGKHGPNFLPGNVARSRVLEQIGGKDPGMPKEGDPLTSAEVALVERWIREGAHDDTPADAYSTRLKEPPTYTAAPVITSLAVSPDGNWLAISGYHEVLLFDAATLTLKSRLLGDSPRIESLAFSADSKRLAVGAGAPAQFGEVQIWEVATAKELTAWKFGNDSLFGVSWSPEGTRLAFGGADKSVRIIDAADGKELMKCDSHSDWVFRTVWLGDGKRIVSGSRDKAMKLIDAKSGQFIDDINKTLEPVTSLVRHPKEDWAAYGGAEGGVRLYKMKENQDRAAGDNDVNLVREFERQPGPVQAVAFSPDGAVLAVGSTGGEVRLYRTADGGRAETLAGHDGAVFALAFTPDGKRVFTGGFDGLVRVFDPATGKLSAVFIPVALSPTRQVVTK
jgi:WD40 repeat protein/mono/diheme cytochrome c family protein